MKREETREAAIDFVNNGGKCLKQFGYSFKGARPREISNEEAKLKIKNENWDFGKGYWELDWLEYEGETCLRFTEYSEADMW